MDGILSSSLGISADLAASKGHGQDRLEEFTVKPQENAVDFSEIQETIEGGEAEEFILPPTISLPSAFAVPRPPALPLAADKRKAPVHKIMSNAQKDRLKSLKEDISNGRIRFTDMFGPGVPEKSTSDVSKGSLVPDRKATMHVVEDEGYRLGRDDRDLFYRLNEELEEWKDIVEEEEEQLQDGALDEMMDLDAPRTNNTRRKKLDKSIEKKYLPLELDVWEDRVVWDDSEPETMVESLPNANVTTVTPMETTKATQKQKYG